LGGRTWAFADIKTAGRERRELVEGCRWRSWTLHCIRAKVGRMNGETASQKEQATLVALWRSLAFVLLPGLALATGVIALVIPPLPPISSLHGCYRSSSSPIIRVSPGLISVRQEGIRPVRMFIETGKEGYVINAVTGFSFRKTGTVAYELTRTIWAVN
jgi:hypothetical protein